MPYFPLTHLVIHGDRDRAAAVTGPHVHLLVARSGEVLYTTAEDETSDLLKSQDLIRCVAIDSEFTFIATTGDDKKLKVWKVTDSLEVISERELSKKPTEVAFTRDGQTIVVSDKFGDVFRYPLHPETNATSSTEVAGASKRGSLTSHENPSNGTLVLGHASLLTTFLLTPDERYIITADRDEHIRVSWYPQGYAVERYCMGHEKFVSAVHIPVFKPDVLVSGGGDPVLKVWDWMSGQLLADIAVFEAVVPYIKVRAPKRRRGCSDGDADEDGDAGEDGQKQTKSGGKKSRRSRGKGKGKRKQEVEAREESADAGEPSAGAEEATGGEPVETGDSIVNVQVETSPEEDVLVFVVQSIRSVDRGENGRFIIFSVVGATALYYTPFPSDEGNLVPIGGVQVIDFGVPVVDFTTGQNGDVWVMVDAEWKGLQDAPSDRPRFVRLLTWNGGVLSESTNADVPLLTALNSKCLVPATPVGLKTLDLYSALSSMPKNVNPEHDPLIRDTLSEAATMDVDEKQLTQRELGRLKKKKALLAKIQESEKGKRGASGTEAGTVVLDERETKRAKSDGGVGPEEYAPVSGDVPDVGMDAS